MNIEKEALRSFTPKKFWETYKELVYKNKYLTQDQDLECMRAFFAGMHASFDFQMQVAENLSENDATETMDKFHASLVSIAVSSLFSKDN